MQIENRFQSLGIENQRSLLHSNQAGMVLLLLLWTRAAWAVPVAEPMAVIPSSDIQNCVTETEHRTERVTT
jgi:hypothetical protein